MRKSDLEVDCMKKAGKALAKARPDALQRIKGGMTEREAAIPVIHVMIIHSQTLTVLSGRISDFSIA